MKNQPINKICPRSGKPIVLECQTEYRGQTVAFCNPGCRDDFAAHVDERPKDRAYFDAIIDEGASG
ncbi:MAG: YHS domain-containing protein [Planctomycetota bacterium]|nr:YHS domain-containing protein [Planctomycetota bacterium]